MSIGTGIPVDLRPERQRERFQALNPGSSFSPLSIAGAVAWYDASNTGTLFSDTGRTTPATPDGAVLGVTDLSGAGNHLSEATNGPTYKAAVQNGRSVLRFDGVNDLLQATGLSVSQPDTIFVVHSVSPHPASDANIYDGVTARQSWRFVGGANDTWRQFAGTDQIRFFGADQFMHVVSSIFNGASSRSWMDGVGSSVLNIGANALTSLVVGASQALGSFLGGDICEIIIYNSALSTTDRTAVESYLATKWGTLYAGPIRTGLVNWYDFAALPTLWQNTARTTPVTADGQAILGVDDKSGAGNHLSEATNGPTYKVNIQNGRSVARFDGTNDVLGGTIAADASSTWFVVVKKRSAPGAARGIAVLDGNALLYTDSSVSATGLSYYRNEAAAAVVLGGTATDTNIVALRVSSASLLESFVNGGAPTASFDPHAAVTTSTTYTTGASGDYDQMEVLRYDSALSVTDLNTVGSYLAAKWGTTWSTVGVPYIPGLVAWYDFSDIATLFKDTGRSDPVTTSGDVIRGVTDKSGAGNHLSRSGGTAPTYESGIQNGRSISRFQVGTDVLSASTAARATATYLLVFKKRSAEAGSSGIVSLVQAANGTLASGQGGGNITNYNQNEGGGAPNIGNNPTAWHVLTVKVVSASSLVTYSDGTQTGSFDPKDVITTGTGFSIGEAVGIAAAADYDYGEVRIYNTALSDTDREASEADLQTRWATP